MDASDPLSFLGDVFATLPIAMVLSDRHGRIHSLNHEAETLLGYRAGDLAGHPVETLIPEAKRELHARHRQDFYAAPRAMPMGRTLELFARRADGRSIPVEIALKPILTNRGLMVLSVIVDVSARKQLEQHLRERTTELEASVAARTAELERRNRDLITIMESLETTRTELDRLSREDPLTGLMNRREFAERFDSELRRAQRRISSTCVAMWDLDHFKRVNDAFGHTVGDDVLRRVAQVFKAHCRIDDLIARYGGEEFAMVLPETELKDALAICERIRAAIQAYPWSELHADLAVTMSAGVVPVLPQESMASALTRADALLYEAKRRGRNRIEPNAPEPPKVA